MCNCLEGSGLALHRLGGSTSVVSLEESCQGSSSWLWNVLESSAFIVHSAMT